MICNTVLTPEVFYLKKQDLIISRLINTSTKYLIFVGVECFSCRLKNIFYMEGKLFSSAICLKISNVFEENGIEESIISVKKTLKRKIIDTFPEEISFYPKLYKSLSFYCNSSERRRFKSYLC